MKKFRYFILVLAGVAAMMLGGCKDKEKYDESAFQDDLEPLSEDEVEAMDQNGDDEMAVLFQVENGAVKSEKQPVKLLVGQNGAKFLAVAQDFERKKEEFRLLLPCAVRKIAVNVPDVPLFPCLRFHQRRKVPFRLRRAVQQNEVRLPVVCFHDISSLIA